MSVISLDAQVAVEQHVTAHAEHPVAGPAAIAQAEMRREPDRGPAIANQDRRDSDLQPVETIGLEELRYATLQTCAHAACTNDERCRLTTRGSLLDFLQLAPRGRQDGDGKARVPS